MESWIFINNELTRYKISSEGYVISTSYNGIPGYVKPLKHNHDADGYFIITLNHNGKKYTRKIHRLVAEAFIPNPDNLPQVNHKDGNKENNNVENLEWVSGIDNIHHACNNNLRYARNAEEIVEEVCAMLESNAYTIKEISEETGMIPNDICRIYRGDRWKTISSKYDFSKFDKWSEHCHPSIHRSKREMIPIVTDICKSLEVGESEMDIINKYFGGACNALQLVQNIKYRKCWTKISNNYKF